MITKEIQTDLGVYQKRADGILVFRVSPSKNSLSIHDLSDQLVTFLDLQNGTPSPFLMCVPEIQYFGADEKKFVNENIASFATAAALVTNSPITKYIGHILLYLSRPTIPRKVFTDEEKAIDWLNKK